MLLSIFSLLVYLTIFSKTFIFISYFHIIFYNFSFPPKAVGQKRLPIKPGKYPDMIDKGVNTPDCGLRYVRRPHKLYFNKKCFKNKNKIKESTYWDIELIRDELFAKKRILRAQDAEYGEAPWTVILTQEFLRFIPYYDCTGVLITYEWVLTAAHCYSDSYATNS